MCTVAALVTVVSGDVFIRSAPTRLHNEARPKEATPGLMLGVDLDMNRYV